MVLEEDLSTCCVTSPSDVKYPRLLDVNTTAGCPEAFLMQYAPYGLGKFALLESMIVHKIGPKNQAQHNL